MGSCSMHVCAYVVVYCRCLILQKIDSPGQRMLKSHLLYGSASIALKLTVEVCPELRKHMKVLPKTGFIQAQSTFNAQLKFLPR